MESCKSICTHLSQNEKFSKDEGVEKVDVTAHRSIIRCLMFLTATRPDIMFPHVRECRAIDYVGLWTTCAVTMMVAASANSLNQIELYVFEIKNEAKMKRTMHRPLPSDRISAPHAVAWAWSSTKQDVVAQSTAEVECVAPALAVNQALWLRKLLTDLKMTQEETTTIFVDN
nr:Retrovirus-related Pol polyprotein from transposon RE1 [Ipomoea batatas]